MPDKKVVGSSTSKSTKTATEPDGTVVETTTTTVTETYDDGTSGTRTKTETRRKAPVGRAVSKPGAGAPTASKQKVPLLVAQDPATCNAPKAENTTDSKFIQEVLTRHNELREKHGAPPLTLNVDLGKIAMAWATKIAKDGKMQHNNSGFGENVYWNTDSFDGKRPVDMWYSEIKDYNFNKLEPQKGAGHFTQLIWKNTKEVGIAMASGSKGKFVVANYNPPGNIINRYADNIQK